MTLRYAEIGTVSHGTLRPEDLLESLANELEHHVQRNASAWCSDKGRHERNRLIQLIWLAREFNTDNDMVDEFITELEDELQAFAPPGCYFGTHPGDGSDFGYWPNEID